MHFGKTYHYCFGDVVIIYAFSQKIYPFLKLFNIIYAFWKDIYPYYYGDLVIIYAFSQKICQFFKTFRYNLCILERHTPIATEM